MKKALIITLVVLLAAAAGGLAYYFLIYKNLSGSIVIPYISHQKPRIDPHVPSEVPIADKLDEVLFDGIFNVSANPSGIVYEDGLGEFMGIDEDNIVSIRLKASKRWHRSFSVVMEKKKISVGEREAVLFTAKDLRFTLRRIQKLGSLSPDYILVSQAVEDFDFSGPNENDEIRFKFRDDRIWTESDIKEVLSFKVLPASSEINAPEYHDGTGPYMLAGEYEDAVYFYRNPAEGAAVANLILKPFIDNSTFTTELKNRNINTLLSSPFGSVSPLLADTAKYFYKSSISTCFFALFHNVNRLSREQRVALRSLIDNQEIMGRFYRIGTEQQRHVADYKGNVDNYSDYLNYSVFPTSSYYVEEQVVVSLRERDKPDLSVLPDTVRIKTCINFGYKEELSALVEILNDPYITEGRVKATTVSNQEIGGGDYDAVLVAVSGYRSNFLFDLYDIFLRSPDFSGHSVNLQTVAGKGGERMIDQAAIAADRNFFRLDPNADTPEREDIGRLYEYVYNFMSTRHIGDKQAYAQMIDQLDQDMALGSWLFSLPSLAYFTTQFDNSSIDLYGVASQLSTIEKWRERTKR